MCGRFVVISPPALLRATFGCADAPDIPLRHNIAPTQPILLVGQDHGGRHAMLARWGFVPAWVKDPNTFSLLINARAETAVEKPAFRNAMKRRRCLIPADGFYEWQRRGTARQPWLIRPAGDGPFAFAGLWETWSGPNGEEVDTAVILTTPAAPVIAHIHDRMPAILPPPAWDIWLDCDRVDARMAQALLIPAADRTLRAHPVSTAVNRLANDSPALLDPVSADAPPPAARDGRQGTLF